MHIRSLIIVIVGSVGVCYAGHEVIDLQKIINGNSKVRHACFLSDTQLIVSTDSNELYQLTIDDDETKSSAKKLTNNLYPGSSSFDSSLGKKHFSLDSIERVLVPYVPSDTIKKLLICGDAIVVVSHEHTIIDLVDKNTGARKNVRPYKFGYTAEGVEVFSDSSRKSLLVLDDRYPVYHARIYTLNGLESTSQESRLLLPSISSIQHACARYKDGDWILASVHNYDLGAIHVYQVREGFSVRILEHEGSVVKPISGVLVHPKNAYQLVSVDSSNKITKWHRLERDPEDIHALAVEETHGYHPAISFLTSTVLCASASEGYGKHYINIIDLVRNTILKKINLYNSVRTIMPSPSGAHVVLEYGHQSAVLYKDVACIKDDQ